MSAAPRPPALRPQKTAVRIAQQLVADIRARGLTEGDKLPSERAMLEEYEVGRGTLREALRYLELQGILAIRPGPGGGPVVRAPDAGNLASTVALLLEFSDSSYRTIVEARHALEPMIAGLAAERATETLREDLRKSVHLMRERLGEQQAFLEENRRFHDLIAWSSGNALFGYLMDAILEIARSNTLGTDYPLDRRTEIVEAAQAILTAIEAGDAEAGRRAMAAHLERSVEYLQQRQPERFDQGVRWGQLR